MQYSHIPESSHTKITKFTTHWYNTHSVELNFYLYHSPHALLISTTFPQFSATSELFPPSRFLFYKDILAPEQHCSILSSSKHHKSIELTIKKKQKLLNKTSGISAHTYPYTISRYCVSNSVSNTGKIDQLTWAAVVSDICLAPARINNKTKSRDFWAQIAGNFSFSRYENIAGNEEAIAQLTQQPSVTKVISGAAAMFSSTVQSTPFLCTHCF